MSRCLYPFCAIEGGSHGQVYTIADCIFEVVAGQAKVVFQVADDRLNGATATKVLVHLAFCGLHSFGETDYGRRSYYFLATKTTITERSLRSLAADLFHLWQNTFEGVSVIFLAREAFYADNDASGLP